MKEDFQKELNWAQIVLPGAFRKLLTGLRKRKTLEQLTPIKVTENFNLSDLDKVIAALPENPCPNCGAEMEPDGGFYYPDDGPEGGEEFSKCPDCGHKER